ncbi:MAG: SDR family oxidoreductase, partial [Myxococcota bacterium]|nr:SDR family oxidoreductase [Myxococcota bacterium]
GTLVKSATEFHGGLDIVVNNAGITRDKLLMAMKPEDFSDVVDTNLGGCFNVTHQACRGLIRNRKGTVINITSVSGMVGMKGQANYSASKAGIIGFTKAMAKELASRNITVNAVAPGFVESDMTAKLGDMYLKEMLKFIPMGRLGTAQEVGQSVVFLCSGAARYITGQVMVLDGGLTM